MRATSAGENALVLTVSGDQTRDCVAQVRSLANRIHTLRLRGLSSIRPGLDCLLLEFEGDYDANEILSAVGTQFIAAAGAMNCASTLIPCCYEAPFARDLENVANALGLKPQEIIDLHSARQYDVWMIGFMPGYPYLGSLDEKLQLPRKATPELLVPAGSVAIAEEFVGVYPFDSPGGWHIIGCTPLKLVDYSRAKPFLFEYGMKVKFFPITSKEFQQYK
jgi:inhibitor of KinA